MRRTILSASLLLAACGHLAPLRSEAPRAVTADPPTAVAASVTAPEPVSPATIAARPDGDGLAAGFELAMTSAPADPSMIALPLRLGTVAPGLVVEHDAGRVFGADAASGVVALDARTGAVLWQSSPPTSDEIDEPILATRERVLAIARVEANAELLLLDATTGAELSRTAIPRLGPEYGPPGCAATLSGAQARVTLLYTTPPSGHDPDRSPPPLIASLLVDLSTGHAELDASGAHCAWSGSSCVPLQFVALPADIASRRDATRDYFANFAPLASDTAHVLLADASGRAGHTRWLSWTMSSPDASSERSISGGPEDVTPLPDGSGFFQTRGSWALVRAFDARREMGRFPARLPSGRDADTGASVRPELAGSHDAAAVIAGITITAWSTPPTFAPLDVRAYDGRGREAWRHAFYAEAITPPRP